MGNAGFEYLGEIAHAPVIFGEEGDAALIGVTTLEGMISVTSENMPRDLTESQVREIRRRRPDVWWNGTLIGAGAGLAASAIAVNQTCGGNDPECEAIAGLVFGVAFVGGGMGAGALIDFAIRQHETVFSRANNGTNRSFQVSPILGKKSAGFRISFKF